MLALKLVCCRRRDSSDPSSTLAGDSQYQCQLEGIPGVQLITYDETEKCDFQYIVLEIDERITGISRDQLIELLHAENVLARRYFYPGCHRMEPYRSCWPNVWSQ